MDFKAGDVVVQRMWTGWHRDVLIDELNMHNGHPAFTGWVVEETCNGDLIMKNRVWGYQTQIVRVLGPTVHNDDSDRVYVYNH